METMDSIFHALLGSRNTENPNISTSTATNLTEMTSFEIFHRPWSSGALDCTGLGQVGELVFSLPTFGRRSWEPGVHQTGISE